MVEYMDQLIGRLLDGMDQLGILNETLVLFYSDNGTDRRIKSNFQGQLINGGKNTTAQTGIRVPLIANWRGKIQPGLHSGLVEASDFLPTLAALAGKTVPDSWQIDGVSFAPQLLGQNGASRDWAFFWYDPRPGWDKDQFQRSIFALDHRYKLFSDGRMFDIEGQGLREVALDLHQLNNEQKKARYKLSAAITQMMRDPMSKAARIEVDAFGEPVKAFNTD
jgi:arylsulfatase A